MDQSVEENSQVHALAFVEVTAAVVHLYRNMLPLLEQHTKQLSFHIEITDATVGERFLYMVPFKLQTVGWTFGDSKSPLQSANPKKDGTLTADDLVNDPDRAAFRLVERLCLFFGVQANKISHTVETGGVVRVDTACVAALRSNRLTVLRHILCRTMRGVHGRK